jgi:arylsulfatase
MTLPNLLFIFTDEQRYDTLAAAGNHWLQMPNLNRLAERSCVFEQACCTQPVCTPSRASILTGLYPHATGAVHNNLPLRDDVACLPELLPAETRHKYVTGYHGKWHLGDEIFPQHGFDQWRSIEDGYRRGYRPGRDRAALSDYAQWLRARGFKPDCDGHFSRGRACCLPEAHGKPAFLAQQAARFIHQHRDRPFILYVNFLEPHMPFFGPRTGLYDPETIVMPPNFGHFPGETDSLDLRLKAERFRREGFEWYDLSTAAGWRQMAAAYYGLCTLVDHHAGRILQALDTNQIADRTIVVFTSDHGEMMGSFRILGKGVPLQESVRVPCLLHLPGQTAMQRVRGPFSQIDLVPTLLELLGQPVPDTLHGRSLAGRIGAQDFTLDDDIFIQWNADPAIQEHTAAENVPDWKIAVAGSAQRARDAARNESRTVITRDLWRFTLNTRLPGHELFDLNTDPLERNNLAADPQHLARMTDLLTRIKAWQQRVGDTLPLPESIAPSP